MPSSDHVKAYEVARRVEEPLHGQIRLYNEKSAEAGKLNIIQELKHFFNLNTLEVRRNYVISLLFPRIQTPVKEPDSRLKLPG